MTTRSRDSGITKTDALSDMAGFELLAADVEEALAHPECDWNFTPALTDHFEAETSRERSRHLVISGIFGLVMYEIFLLSDFTLNRAHFTLSAIVRLGIVGPLAIAWLIALSIGVPPKLREVLETVMLLLVGLSVLYLAWMSRSADVIDDFLVGMLLPITFANVVVRLRFWQAVALTTVLTIASLPLLGFLKPLVGMNLAVVMGVNVAFTLYANYLLERDMRHVYLLALRDRIGTARLAIDNTALDELARVDPLTGVSNRRDLDTALERLLAHPDRPLALVLFDVDRFKDFNDVYGHQAGDTCLRMIADEIRAGLRGAGDVAARMGGDEFVAVIQGADVEEAHAIADRVRQAVDALRLGELDADGKPGPDGTRSVTLSAGIAVAHGEMTAAALVSQADGALYRAKRGGRDRVSV